MAPRGAAWRIPTDVGPATGPLSRTAQNSASHVETAATALFAFCDCAPARPRLGISCLPRAPMQSSGTLPQAHSRCGTIQRFARCELSGM